MTEGAVYGMHRPSGYKDQKPWPVEEVILLAGAEPAEADRGQLTAEGINLARELVEIPANDLGPEEFAMRAAQEGAAAGLEVEVFDETALAEMGAGALLAVGQGSVRPPRLVRLSYVPENPTSNDHLFLVGKGITFDTGGLSLKPPSGMEKMKYDMGGAGTMLGAITAIGRLKPGVRVSCLLAMAENMPSGTATRPGDIITALNGKTIEVINTDAEGRLVLADALTYATRLGATHIVNAATLTGAVSVALGSIRVALLGNDKDLGDAIASARPPVRRKVLAVADGSGISRRHERRHERPAQCLGGSQGRHHHRWQVSGAVCGWHARGRIWTSPAHAGWTRRNPTAARAPAAWPCGRLCVWPKAGASDLAKRSELR